MVYLVVLLIWILLSLLTAWGWSVLKRKEEEMDRVVSRQLSTLFGERPLPVALADGDGDVNHLVEIGGVTEPYTTQALEELTTEERAEINAWLNIVVWEEEESE